MQQATEPGDLPLHSPELYDRLPLVDGQVWVVSGHRRLYRSSKMWSGRAMCGKSTTFGSGKMGSAGGGCG